MPVRCSCPYLRSFGRRSFGRGPVLHTLGCADVWPYGHWARPCGPFVPVREPHVTAEIKADGGPIRRREAGRMFQVRIHGRGGQGVVTAAELLSVAAFTEGRYAQAFPSFGSERMGAPVVSYCRIADQAIRSHEPVAEPDALIIQDPTLLHQPGLLTGLRADGYLLINSTHEACALGLGPAVAQ